MTLHWQLVKPIALTIAGSDPSGGAGLQADLKTFHQFGVYGEAVVTLLTVQDTLRVSRVEVLSPEFVTLQLRAVLDDIPPHAVKTGALGSAEIVRAVAAIAREYKLTLVVDPVMISKHKSRLISEDAQEALLTDLFPYAALVTPNLLEASALLGVEINTVDAMHDAARELFQRTGAPTLVKGGHLEGAATDILFDGTDLVELRDERIWTTHTHGTGCTYSAAITAWLAIGLPLREAVQQAKSFITEAIRTNPGLGRGHGPLNHHARALQ